MFSKILSLRADNDRPIPLSDGIIRKVNAFCEMRFGCALPDDYVAFLRASNGFLYNGCGVCCCYTDDIEKRFPAYAGYDLVTLNMRFQDNTDIHDYLLLGRSSLDYLCYEKATGMYQVLSNGTMDVIRRSDRLADVIGEFFGIDG